MIRNYDEYLEQVSYNSSFLNVGRFLTFFSFPVGIFFFFFSFQMEFVAATSKLNDAAHASETGFKFS